MQVGEGQGFVCIYEGKGHGIVLHVRKLHDVTVYLDTNWVNEGKY
jgi:hypothetical protein